MNFLKSSYLLVSKSSSIRRKQKESRYLQKQTEGNSPYWSRRRNGKRSESRYMQAKKSANHIISTKEAERVQVLVGTGTQSQQITSSRQKKRACLGICRHKMPISRSRHLDEWRRMSSGTCSNEMSAIRYRSAIHVDLTFNSSNLTMVQIARKLCRCR